MLDRPRSVSLIVLALLGPIAGAPAQVEPTGESGAVPAAFGPYSDLIGRWKGQAVPADDPLRGWRESHEWAWAFEGGKPVGMALAIEGGKVLKAGRLTFDPESSSYRLEGIGPGGESVAFVGTRDSKTNAMTLGRSGPEGEDRLTIRPNSNGIRSDFWFDRKAPGSPQYARLVRANLGKEGVTFAAGGAVTGGSRCIVTGGAATIAVSAGGSTFPVCCSGCRDEVLADPGKYAQQLKERMASAPSDGSNAIGTGRGDGSFGPTPGRSSEVAKGDAPKPGDLGDRPDPGVGPDEDPEPDPEPSPTPSADAEARRKAASLLRLGQTLEKQGKADGALGFYRRVVSEAPGTPEAKTAGARIEALTEED
ncbi:tetratricopeptide repeat protein [Tautonia plasticadhaerens]|uniref:Uncharacterized protein n=1 Tax=Tautonia plasticadhaerens TaxID=2527974 RepID=A0A518H0H5_9BACT|nr:tetratricopeptide repeat protein [Tautonia plasticadhaerens]QDV34342.1 hypothetical protein ElP_22270 [Tautonia plasticadhaerens]